MNATLEAANLGIKAGDAYGWRIYKDTPESGYNIFFTEDQLAGVAKGTALDDVTRANTAELAAAEAAGNVEDAMVDGSATTAVKTVNDAQGKPVSVSYIDGGSFVADPEITE